LYFFRAEKIFCNKFNYSYLNNTCVGKVYGTLKSMLVCVLSYVYRSAKFDAKFFNFFARLFICFYFQSEKFRTSANGKMNKQASEKVDKFRIKLRKSVNVA